MKTEEYYQEAIELTEGQRKAFDALRRAVKRCEKEKILFYHVLRTLGALNGNNVASIDEGGLCNAPNSLMYKKFPSLEIAESWADDTHYITLHEEM
jgi:hypothetical protein